MRPGQGEVARGESIAVGLFIDGVPESIALGLTIAGEEIGLALLVGILVGNVVEAYGAAQPIAAGAVLAVVSIAIIPHAFSQVSRWTACATVIGFVGGYLLS